MSPSSVRELWSKLDSAGLTVGAMPAAGEAHTPWYVRAMLGIAGLIAAMFLLGFVGAGFSFVLENKIVSLTVGLMVIAGAYALFRAFPQGDFASMFALAVSIAGQMLVVVGIFGFFDHATMRATPVALIAVIEALLAVAMPNFIHRAASAYAAGIAFAYACEASGAHFIAAGVVAAAIAYIWLNEARLGKLHSIVTPVGYGLTLAFVQMEGTALMGHSMAALFGPETVYKSWPWIGEALILAALVVSVSALLRRAGWVLPERRAVLALIAAAAIGAASFKAPGIAGGLMIVLLGFANGNRVLVGLGIAALLFYVSGYYYLLDATLLLKSGVLAATAVALLAARWLVLNVVMPKERRDA